MLPPKKYPYIQIQKCTRYLLAQMHLNPVWVLLSTYDMGEKLIDWCQIEEILYTSFFRAVSYYSS